MKLNFVVFKKARIKAKYMYKVGKVVRLTYRLGPETSMAMSKVLASSSSK